MPACSVNCLLQGSISCGSICSYIYRQNGPLSGIVFIFFRLGQSKLFDLNACINIASGIVFESLSLEIWEIEIINSHCSIKISYEIESEELI